MLSICLEYNILTGIITINTILLSLLILEHTDDATMKLLLSGILPVCYQFF